MKRKLLLATILLLMANTFIYAQSKPNDYLVAKIKNPTCGAAVFKYHEFTVENTSFLSKAEYRATPFVQKQFTKDGRFDEVEWDRFYELLSDEWFRFCYWGYKNCSELEVWKLNPDGTMPYYAPSNLKIIQCHGCTFWKIIR